MDELTPQQLSWDSTAELSLSSELSSLIAERLRQVHAHVAESTAARTPDAFGRIAVHYERSGSRDRAYEYAMVVAERGKKNYAFGQVAEFLSMAERNADTPEQLADAQIRLAELAEAQGMNEKAVAYCDAALEFFNQRGDRRKALPLQRMRERLNGALGQPFRRTLGACFVLDEEATELGLEGEHVALLTMVSQMYSRLGERAAAQRIASECVTLAEQLENPALIADALNRLGLACDRPDEAAELYRRALDVYRSLEDRRGQARCHNNLGIYYTRLSDWAHAEQEFADALALSRSAGLQDLWGLAAMNLAVVYLKSGDFERARDHFGEAFAVFVANKNSEYELYALYNLANLDRERGEYQAAADLYNVTGSLARRLGQADVEAGALGGAGLAMLRQGRIDSAYAALRGAEERISSRDGEWFQGRETVEALAVGIAAHDGRTADALTRLEKAVRTAEAYDLYSAAWLAAECARILSPTWRVPGTRLSAMLAHYAWRIAGLNCSELNRRFAALLSI